MVTETIHTTVEVGDVERDVTLIFSLLEEEKPSRASPGHPIEAELVVATFDDDGSVVPEKFLRHMRDLGREAFEQRADRESAMAEDAADAAREFRRDGY